MHIRVTNLKRTIIRQGAKTGSLDCPRTEKILYPTQKFNIVKYFCYNRMIKGGEFYVKLTNVDRTSCPSSRSSLIEIAHLDKRVCECVL